MFSVIIPYYNKSPYILRCLDTVFAQTFKQFEVILVDDGSTDGGIELVKQKYGQKLTLIIQKNQGVSAARNAGIKASNNEYLAFLDADDMWHSQYLEIIYNVICTEQNVKIIGAHYSRDKDFLKKRYSASAYFKFKNYFKSAIRNTYFTSSSAVVKRLFFEQNEGFNVNLKKGEDHDVWFRVMLSSGKAFYITDTLVYYSDEDLAQATKNKMSLEKDLVGNINTLYRDYLSSSKNQTFKKFISLYVYFNLYTYYYDDLNRSMALKVLNNIHKRFFLLEPVYFLPFSLGKRFVNSQKYNRFIRLYLKFIIRYIIN